ncbi:type I inositol 1,4,5-trisphosphate 5-phosphatase CVP2 [Carex littledalei]|uniref:Type I inositol 1,4,5-trisphosphate 5-phosphatase CVP2 n=1 Tax=Carex littledalei TaxID=544730 RepID=A0A833QZV7_9POAL|nr:type I inositol 1,4,5-trisphosphate 5-phosphatase CVP2 [Carex littledalei]
MALAYEEKRKPFRPKVFWSKDKKESNTNEKSIKSSGFDIGESPSQKASSPSSFRYLSDKRNAEHKPMRFSSFRNHITTPPVKTEAFRVFVATWNVGGKTPTMDLNLNDFLPENDHSDIYVLGFQEIVPLNAGNVLVMEDHEPASIWLALINQALNNSLQDEPNNDNFQFPTSHSRNSSQDTKSASNYSSSHHPKTSSGGNSLIFQGPSLKSFSKAFMAQDRKHLKTCNCPVEMTRKSYRDACFAPFSCKHSKKQETVSSDEEEEEEEEGDDEMASCTVDGMGYMATPVNQRKYDLVACKKLVGIFVSVWARKELVQHIGHLRVSCVSRGLMGYLGNKGCISVSMSLHQTTFCFICSHLASGEKEGDELKRNYDVIEILKNTQFQRICRRSGRKIPERITDHERIIWLGDLNYRIALNYAEARKLLEDNNWDALFEKDQLKIEREAGRVFKGWNEGKIYFAPTYKYSSNSDSYLGETVTSKKKRRTPAWCDRVLWHGDGIVQLSYFRGESKFSDHRPVCGAFIVEVGVLAGKPKPTQTLQAKFEERIGPSNSFSFFPDKGGAVVKDE